MVVSASRMDEQYNSKEKCAPIEENNSETETRLRTVKHNSLSLCIQCVPSMYRGRVFIGDGSPTTLRYYTVMPPNNYIPGIFSGYNCIFTSFWQITSEPLLPIGPITAHWAQTRSSPFGEQDSLRGFRSAYSPTPSFASLRLRTLHPGIRRRRLGVRLSSLIFAFAFGASVFAVCALVFATLRLSSSSPLAPRSLP